MAVHGSAKVLLVHYETTKEGEEMTLTNYEQETIITFNKEEKVAHIFTYEKTWQQHLEKRLKLKPIMDNGFGGKDYELPKERIKMPRAKRKADPVLMERLRASRNVVAT